MRRVSHAIERVEVTFDDPNLVANAGLILVGTLCVRLELERLVNTMVQLGQRVGGAKPGRKVLSLVHAIVAGGSHIDHADVLRSGGSAGVLPFRVMAPSTLGTFLRCFTFGHVRQLEAVIAETLRRAWALGAGPGATRLVISSSPRLADGVAALLSFCKGRHPDPVWEEMAKLDYSGDADAMRMWVAGQLPIADSLHRAGDGDEAGKGKETLGRSTT